MFIGIAVTHSPTCRQSPTIPWDLSGNELADLSHQYRSTLPHFFLPGAPRLTTTVYTVARTLGPWLVMAGGTSRKHAPSLSSCIMTSIRPHWELPAMHESVLRGTRRQGGSAILLYQEGSLWKGIGTGQTIDTVRGLIHMSCRTGFVWSPKF